MSGKYKVKLGRFMLGKYKIQLGKPTLNESMLGIYKIQLGKKEFYASYELDLNTCKLACDENGKAYGVKLSDNDIGYYPLPPNLTGVSSIEELKIKLDMLGTERIE